MTDKAAVYVHVPFCRARCTYCDFNTYAGLEALMPEYTAAVRREIEVTGERRGPLTVPTVYFGGGTPSLLAPSLLDELLGALHLTSHISRDAEITLEANPGTVGLEELQKLRALGINRLSLGIQSARDEELRLLGRIHSWTEAVKTVGAARAAGFDNLNLDFIFGLPGQTLDHWHETLEAALSLAPEHLSLYCLSIEEGTPLAEQIANPRSGVVSPDPDLAAEMYELAEDVLANAGWFHYEISNWATSNPQYPTPNTHPKRWWPQPEAQAPKPATTSEEITPLVCYHNLTYWRNEPWLGFGAGAHSWLEGCRQANVPHPRDYIAALERGDAPVAEVEPIDRRLEMGETMMLGLRLAEGVDDARFRTRFGVGLETAFGEELAQLRDQGLLTWDGRTARLTAQGRLLGNQVFMCFV